MHRWLSPEPKHVTPGVAFSAGTQCALSEISIAETQRSAFVQRGFCGGYAPHKPLIRFRLSVQALIPAGPEHGSPPRPNRSKTTVSNTRIVLDLGDLMDFRVTRDVAHGRIVKYTRIAEHHCQAIGLGRFWQIMCCHRSDPRECRSASRRIRCERLVAPIIISALVHPGLRH